MSFANLSIRTIAIATALVAAGTSANALTIGTSGLVANSVQAFSQDSLDQFDLFAITVAPLGNTTALATVGAFNLPITSITVDSKLKVTGGSATGSALKIARTLTAGEYSVTVANFSLDYVNNKVLADVTIANPGVPSVTTAQTALYNFHVATPLGLKYKFPLTITGHEVLDQLFLTPEAQQSMYIGLKLPKVALSVLPSTDFGTLTQDIKVAFRKAVSNTPYVAP